MDGLGSRTFLDGRVIATRTPRAPRDLRRVLARCNTGGSWSSTWVGCLWCRDFACAPDLRAFMLLLARDLDAVLGGLA